jgi:hypothetical protein
VEPQVLRSAEAQLATELWAPKTVSAPPALAPLGGTSLDEVEWFKKMILLPLLQTPLHWGYRVTIDSLRRYRFRGKEFGARAKRVVKHYRRQGLQ